MPSALWQPSPEEQENTLLTRFSKKVQERYELSGLRIFDFTPVVNRLSGTILGEVWRDCEVRSSARVEQSYEQIQI